MARQNLTAQVPIASSQGSNPYPAVNAADIVFTASDPTNKEMVDFHEKNILLFRNSGASARNITVTSVAEKGRTGDLTYSLGAGESCILGPFQAAGWRQAGTNKLHWEAEHAEVLVAVVRT